MNLLRFVLVPTLAVASLSLNACASPAPAVAPASPHGHPDHHHAGQPAPSASSAVAGQQGAPTRIIELPGMVGPGEGREVRVLVDEPALKLASIVLRKGTVLPPHHASVPVTILALQGSGTVVSGTQRLRLDATHSVMLSPGVPHAVEPAEGTDLVLLVHHLGRGEDHHH